MRSSVRLLTKKTALNEFHRRHGGKMVEFCGWDMPVQYPTGVLKEHIICRQDVALFDVAHMGQLRWTGRDVARFIEFFSPMSTDVAVGQAKLSVLLNKDGGVVDDTIITRQADYFFQIVNAGCAEKDLAHLRQLLSEFKGDVHLEVLDRGLIALQGPKAQALLQSLVPSSVDLKKMAFMTGVDIVVGGIKCYVTRCGYTGEDGFEVAPPNEKAEELAELFLSKGAQPAGLGARDSLRLEAGLCLYGHELNETITPVEAGLLWLIPPKRRESGGFLGAQRVQADIKNGVERKRVGLIVEGAPAREGVKLQVDDKEVGFTTSGGPSPVLKKNIAMAYVKTAFAKKGTSVKTIVRNKLQNATVTTLPFVQTNYHRVQ